MTPKSQKLILGIYTEIRSISQIFAKSFVYMITKEMAIITYT